MRKTECDCNIIHTDTVKQVSENIANAADAANAVKLFKALGDNTRMSIVNCLLHSELCVCDIAYLTNMTKSAISHQLAVLKAVRVVRSERRGKEMFYSLDDEHIKDIIATVLEHTHHTSCMVEDQGSIVE